MSRAADRRHSRDARDVCDALHATATRTLAGLAYAIGEEWNSPEDLQDVITGIGQSLQDLETARRLLLRRRDALKAGDRG